MRPEPIRVINSIPAARRENRGRTTLRSLSWDALARRTVANSPALPIVEASEFQLRRYASADAHPVPTGL
jgi:hypothetical protein